MTPENTIFIQMCDAFIHYYGRMCVLFYKIAQWCEAFYLTVCASENSE